MLEPVKEIPFLYELTSISEPPFIIPDSDSQHNSDIFSVAENFGTVISLPYDVNITSTGGSIKEPSVTTQLKKVENGPVIVPLGFRLHIPKDMAFYHENLLKQGVNFLIDWTMKDWYRVNLYLKVEQAQDYMIEQGTPVLRVLPLTDASYQFTYKRMFTK